MASPSSTSEPGLPMPGSVSRMMGLRLPRSVRPPSMSLPADVRLPWPHREAATGPPYQVVVVKYIPGALTHQIENPCFLPELAFNEPPIVLTGTALIIIACYIFRYSPTGIRTTVALLQQIDPSIEEASQSLGAGSGTTFRRITLPLILPAFFAGLGVVFIRSMTAISATIFLVSINWTLITVRILENMTELSLGAAAAFSVLVVVIVFVVIAAIGLALRRFRHAGAGELTSILGG
ncbi:MAG: ABC transporter permease subunit [candidate division NC10 bacterium]|nr:ABC transporter permease subunit [candidate division NC10 bacterium]